MQMVAARLLQPRIYQQKGRCHFDAITITATNGADVTCALSL